MVCFLRKDDFGLAELLLSAKGQRPALVFVEPGSLVPYALRSTRNVACMKWAPGEDDSLRLKSILQGFLSDHRQVAAARFAVGQALAARHCAQKHVRSDVDAIVAKYGQRGIPWARTSSNHFVNLPADPELAAEELRRRLEVRSPAIGMKKTLQQLGNFELLQMNICSSGYFIPEGVLGPENLIVTKKTDVRTRRRFTIAHELGHAIVKAMGSFSGFDEEEWCNKFASSLLMPRHEVRLFADNVPDLAEWLQVRSKFYVSRATASLRAWTCERKVLVFSQGATRTQSPNRQASAELIELGSSPSCPKELRGKLKGGQAFVIHKLSASSFVAVADLADSSTHLGDP